MKLPEWSSKSVKETKAHEYALRFAFGGVITAATGLVAHAFGPRVGGVFLAFPAILPATLALVKRQDGRAETVDDARGGRLGAVGLVAFALVLLATATSWPPALTLAAAALAWLAVVVVLWALVYGRD